MGHQCKAFSTIEGVWKMETLFAVMVIHFYHYFSRVKEF